MSYSKARQILIIGGGITGLTIGYELTKKGYAVTIVEKEDEIGGLARSFRYDGFIFDIGPHRFYTDNSRASNLIKEILEGEAISTVRDSKIYFMGKYYQWPLRPSILFRLPLSIQFRAAIDLFIGIIKKKKDAYNFQQYILNNYGITLYNCFFRDYTQKFLNTSPGLLDTDWAKIGMEMAIIDEHLPHRNLWDVFKLTVSRKPVSATFLYPKEGMGSFCNRLAKFITRHGGHISTGLSILDIEFGPKRINSIVTDKGVLECDNFIWTGPIGEICNFLRLPSPNLKYLSLVLYNILLEGKVNKYFQWCYFAGKDIIFNRVSNPTMFGSDLAPVDKTGLCVEVTCQENDQVWNSPQRLASQIKKDLVRVNLINGQDDINSIYIKRISNAYPIYDVDYRHRLSIAKENIGRFQNLILAGRTGLFWYNNMDDCIEQGLDIAERIVQMHRRLNKIYF